MNISGVVVHARPEILDNVRRDLNSVPGVEVHAAGEDGRMVVTIEGESNGALADTHRQLTHIDGVLSAALVYHHFEPDPEEEV